MNPQLNNAKNLTTDPFSGADYGVTPSTSKKAASTTKTATSSPVLENQPLVITDVSGNRLGNVHYTSQNESLSNAIKGLTNKNSRIYYDADTRTFNNKGFVSIKIDKKTGDISVKAPSFILERDAFKEQYIPLLEEYSKNYKNDPNYAYIDESNDAGKSLSTEDVLANIEKEMSSDEFIQNAQSLHNLKRDEEEKTGFKFSDNDIIRRYTIALGDDANDTTAQIVPMEGWFNDLETYNSELGTVQLGDLLKNVYNREKHSDEDLLDMYAEYKDYVEKGYKNDKSTLAKERYIRAAGFVDFMDRRSPETGVIRGFGDVVSQFIYGAAGTAAELEALVIDVLDMDVFRENQGLMKDLEKVKAEHEEKSRFLNANAYAMNALGSIGVHIVNAIAAGQIAGGIVGGISGSLASATGATEAVALTKTAVEGVQAAAKVAELVPELSAVATSMSVSAVEAASAIPVAVSAALWLSSGTQVAKIVNGAVTALDTVVPPVTEALAGGVVEAVVNNPKLTAKVIANAEVSDEAKAKVMEEFAWNIGGWAVGLSASKALKEFGSTTAGRVISDNWAIVNAKIQSKTGAIADAIKVRFSKYDSIEELIQATKNADKKQVAVTNRALRSSFKELAEEEPIRVFGKNAEEIEEALKRVDDKIIEVRNAQNAVTDFSAGARRITHSWYVDNRGWRTAYDNVIKSAGDITSIEKNLGLAAKATGSVEIAGGRLFSQETSNYIGAINEKVRVDWLIENTGLTPELEVAREDIVAKIGAFRKVAPEGSELSDAVENFITNQRAAYYRMNDMFMDMGLENRAQIEYYRSTGQWGEDGASYAYAMRQAELSDIQVSNRNGTFNTRTFVEDMSYQYGATGDYVDPMLAMQLKLTEHARVQQRRELYRAFGDTDFVNRVVKVSGEQSEMARLVTPKVRKNYTKAILDYTRGESENMIMGELSGLYRKKGQLIGEIKASARGIKQKEAAIESLAEKSWVSNIAERSNYVLSMSGDDISNGMFELFGIRSWDELSYNFGEYSFEAYPYTRTRNLVRITDKKGKLVKTVEVDGKEKELLSGWKQRKFTTSFKDLPISQRRRVLEEGVPTGTYAFDDFYNGLESGAKKFLNNKMEDFSANFFGIKLSNNPADRAYIFKRMLTEMDNGDDIARGILANTKSFRDSDWVADLASAQKTLNRQMEYGLKYADELEALKLRIGTAELGIDATDEQIEILIENSIGGIINGAALDKSVKEALVPIFKATGENLDNTVKSYLILQTILKNPKVLRESITSAVSGSLIEKIDAKEINAISSQFYDLFIKRVNDVYNNLGMQLRQVGSSVVETSDVFDEVREITKEIKGLRSGEELTAGKKLIVIGDQNGALQYVEVNPLFADLMNTQPIYKDMTKLQKFNYLWSKLWRMGTTSMSLKSIVNQQFKDTINAFTGGGMFYTFKKLSTNMATVFGDDVVEYFRNFEPDTLEFLVKESDEGGVALKQLATDELLSRAKLLQSETLETKAYQLSQETRFAQFINGESEATVFNRAINKLDDFMNAKFSPNRINDMREGMLRVSVYNNALYEGMKRGYSVEQARIFATQLMDDATTNFARSMYHLSSLQKTVPYLGAAVNGTKSFWRLAMLDPVGVFSRLFGGVIVPTMALTAVSVGSEENRKVWKNLKEYEKNGNLILVLDGQVFTIPLPEEIAALVNPFRQMVESMYDSANHSFWELAANDVLEISPIDLTGFTMLDAYTLGKDPTAWDRVGSGVLRLSSQLLPTPLRASAMVISGKDLYTGADIDRTYKQYNPDTGEAEVMGDYSGQFAKMLAGLFGEIQMFGHNVTSAAMIQKITENIFGVAGDDFLNTLVNYGAMALANEEYQKQIGASWEQAPEMIGERISAPLTATPKKSLAQSAWSSAISALYDEKEAIQQDPTYLGIIREVNDAYKSADQNKIFAANNKRKAYLSKFYNKVKAVVDDLNSKYTAEFTARKYASVISLINFSGDATIGSAQSSQASMDLYYEGKQQAIATLREMGFGNANSGIFGWIRTSSTGSTYIDYATPMAILDGENMAYYSQSTFMSNLETQLAANDITRKNMFGDEYNKVKNNKKAYKQYKADWNAKVVKVLKPYVDRYGVDAVLDDTKTIDMLDQYIFVNNPYKAKDYIKSIFKKEK